MSIDTPRCPRMRWMALRSVRTANTRRRPVHFGHWSTSTSNDLRSKLAQSSLGVAAYNAPPRSRSRRQVQDAALGRCMDAWSDPSRIAMGSPVVAPATRSASEGGCGVSASDRLYGVVGQCSTSDRLPCSDQAPLKSHGFQRRWQWDGPDNSGRDDPFPPVPPTYRVRRCARSAAARARRKSPSAISAPIGD